MLIVLAAVELQMYEIIALVRRQDGVLAGEVGGEHVLFSVAGFVWCAWWFPWLWKEPDACANGPLACQVGWVEWSLERWDDSENGDGDGDIWRRLGRDVSRDWIFLAASTAVRTLRIWGDRCIGARLPDRCFG